MSQIRDVSFLGENSKIIIIGAKFKRYMIEKTS